MLDRDLDTALRQLAADQHCVLSRQQARELGASRKDVRRRLASPDWDPVTDRILRLTGSQDTFHQRCMAAALDAGRRAHISHESAAALWGLPGFRNDGIVVSRPRGGTRRTSALCLVREPRLLPVHHLNELDGVPVTTVARTLFDLAGTSHPGRVERAIDNALSRHLVSTDAIHSITAEMAEHGRTGSTLMRLLCAARDAGYVARDSGLEARFLTLLEKAGLPLPQAQVDVGGSDWIGRVDFLYRRRRLVIEIDSALHHRSKLDREADARRDRALSAAGFDVLRVSDEDIWYRPAEVKRRVRAALRQLAA